MELAKLYLKYQGYDGKVKMAKPYDGKMEMSKLYMRYQGYDINKEMSKGGVRVWGGGEGGGVGERWAKLAHTKAIPGKSGNCTCQIQKAPCLHVFSSVTV